jgi:outer membrane protein
MNVKTVSYSLLAASMLAASPAVLAHEQGDMLLRFGGALVAPKSDNSDVVSVDDGVSASLTFTYFFADNWAVDVLAAWPFSHDITLLDGTDVGSTDHLPPTVSVQYYFNTEGLFRPYIGAGINYTTFFNEKTEGPIAGTNLSLDDSWGLAGQIGVDFMLSEKWFLNADVRYIDIETDASLDGAFLTEVDITPWVYSLQAGFKF